MKRYLKTIFGFMERLKEDHVGAFATQAAYFISVSYTHLIARKSELCYNQLLW